MYNSALRKLATARTKPPRIQLGGGERRSWWSELERDDDENMIDGPLYNVTMMAPMIDIMLPMDLAWLPFTFKFSFSIL